MAAKCVAKPSRSLLQLAILGFYMRRLPYDSATVNISVFIEKRNISFQNDTSLKTMRLGVLSWEKLKHRETQGRIVSLDQLCLGVEEQLLIFSASCLSSGWVKKLQKFINFCLKVSHSSNLKHSKSTWSQLPCDSCEMYKISWPRNVDDLRQLLFWYRALSCGTTDWFTKGVYIWVTNLHVTVPTITFSLLALMNNQKSMVHHSFPSINTILGFENLFGIVLSYDGPLPHPLPFPQTHPRGREL